ncbi:phage tail assembly protein T [Streptomyces antibioticus]
MKFLYDLSVAYRLPPDQVMEQFTEEQMVHLVAYQNLWGPITPQRLDIIAARLGMDVAAPHMKKGRRPRLKDHLMVWSRAARPRRTGRELRAVLEQMRGYYEAQARAENGARRRRGQSDTQT